MALGMDAKLRHPDAELVEAAPQTPQTRDTPNQP